MARPPRARGTDPIESPFVDDEEAAERGGTLVDRPGSDEEDQMPTGEHQRPAALGSDELDAEPMPDRSPRRPPPAASRRRRLTPRAPDLAIANTLPPESRRPAMAADGSTDPDGLDPEIAPADDESELEAAPTRIEREQDILGGSETGADAPRLTIIGGNNRGKQFELKRGDNGLGRGIDNDVVLADIAVSRKHTLICFEGGRFVVRDLGSGNGTLVNGERVESHVLEDGDQLELGNTLLRFNCPPLPVGELARLATVVTPRDLVESAAPAVGAAPAKKSKARRPAPADRTPTGAAVRPRLISARAKRLAILGSIGLVVFLGAMVGVKAYLHAKKKEAIARAAPKPDEILAQEFQEGITDFNAKNWERARTHFLKVLALAPSQGHIRQYVEQASAELVARDALERARARLVALDYRAARQELSKIKAASSYRPQAEVLGRKIDEQEIGALLRAARSLRDSGETAAALEKVKAAQALAPDRADVKELYASISAAHGKKVAPKVGNKTPPRVTPRIKAAPVRPQTNSSAKTSVKVPAGGAAKEGIALYKKRQWIAAYDAVKTWAETQKGSKQKAAKALAESIRIVGQSWTRAEQSRQPAQTLRYYLDALAADAKIEKAPHRKQLKELVVKTARAQASTALARHQYPEAYAAVKAAEDNGGKGDPALDKVMAALQKQAEEIFNRAYTVRTSNLAQARRLWQEVLRMVPPTSPIYRKAYSWLNNSNPNYQDEDEN